MPKKAQSFNEYAMVIAVVALVGMGMQTYIKRGVQGVIKGTADVLMAQGVQPAASALLPIARLNVADGNIYDKTRWNTAFINEYIIRMFGGSVSPSQTNPANYDQTKAIYTGRMTGTIEMVKEGNNVYYYHIPNLADPNNKIIVAAEDAATGILTTFSDVDGQADATYNAAGEKLETYTSLETRAGEGTVRVRNKTFSPYTIVRPSNDALAQQNGIIESGLYDYKQQLNKPLKVDIDRSITSSEASLNNLNNFGLSLEQVHPTAYREYYQGRVTHTPTTDGGVIVGVVPIKIKGHTVYYYSDPDKNEKTLIGAENAITRDFTVFDQDGFVQAVFNQDGEPYLLVRVKSNEEPPDDSQAEVKLIYNEEQGTHKTLSVTVKQKVDGNWVDRGTYGKHQPVKVSQSPTASLTAIVGAAKTTRTIHTDTTTVTGAWDATYKLENAKTFSKQDKTTRPTTPPKPPQ